MSSARLRPPYWAAALAALSFAPWPLQAQIAAPVQARARVSADTTVISVGDRIAFSVEVEHASDASVRWPDSLNLAPFEVLGTERLPPVRAGNSSTSALRLSLTAFELGDLQIPSFQLDVVGPDSVVTSVTTDAYGVSVLSVGLDEGGDIRAIKGPFAIQRSIALLLPWVLIALVLLLGAAWWWRRRDTSGEGRPFREVQIPKAPHVVAYEALDRLRESDLLIRGEIKAYYVEVSEIIRTYLQGRYHLAALEMTSFELLSALEQVGVEGQVLGDFSRFLRRCDLVKFAKLRPSTDDAHEVIDAARHLVDETKPRFDAPPAARNGQGPEDAATVDDPPDEVDARPGDPEGPGPDVDGPADEADQKPVATESGGA